MTDSFVVKVAGHGFPPRVQSNYVLQAPLTVRTNVWKSLPEASSEKLREADDSSDQLKLLYFFLPLVFPTSSGKTFPAS